MSKSNPDNLSDELTTCRLEQIDNEHTYTKLCMECLSGFHMKCMVEDDDNPFKIDFNKIDPFLKIQLYPAKNEEPPYTMGCFLLERKYYLFANQLMHFLSKQKLTKKQYEEAFQLDEIGPKLKSHALELFNASHYPDTKQCAQRNKEFYAARFYRDICFSNMIILMGTETFLEKLFAQKNSEASPLDKYYFYNPNTKKQETIIDICLQYGLPNTAITIIKEQQKFGNLNNIEQLLSGDVTKKALRYYRKNNVKTDMEYSAKELFLYLEKTLPVDLFYKCVLQTSVPYSVYSDYDLEKQTEQNTIAAQNTETPQHNQTTMNTTNSDSDILRSTNEVATNQSAQNQTNLFHLWDRKNPGHTH